MAQDKVATDRAPIRRQPSAAHLLLALVTVAAVAWLAYAPIRGAYFRHDDFAWLAAAQHWMEGTRSLADGHLGVTVAYNLWFRTAYQLWGLNPRPYFTILLLCHTLNSCLVVLLIWLLTRQMLAAWFGGLCFAVLFSHHEATTWVAASPHSFAALWILAAVICWVVYRNGRAWCLPLSVAFTLLAVFTKDSGVAVLPVLLALELTWFRDRSKRPLVWHAGVYVLLVLWRVCLPPLTDPIVAGSADYRPGLHMLYNAVYGVPQILVPDLRFENYLALLQSVLPDAAVGAALVVGHVAIVLITVLALWGLWRGSTMVRFGILWCYLSFLPFLPFSYEYARAPRYLYIPSIGVALLAGLLVQGVAARLKPGLSARKLAAVAVAVAYLAGSFGFARLVCSNRVRDSRMRQSIVQQVTSHVPVASAGEVFWLCGLPRHLEDVRKAIPLYYPQPVNARVSCAVPPPGAYFFRFDPTSPASLIEFRRVPEPSLFP